MLDREIVRVPPDDEEAVRVRRPRLLVLTLDLGGRGFNLDLVPQSDAVEGGLFDLEGRGDPPAEDGAARGEGGQDLGFRGRTEGGGGHKDEALQRGRVAAGDQSEGS